MKKLIIALIVVALAGLGFYFIRSWYADRLLRNPALASGNGRIEATEINIAARLAGKVEMIKVMEGEKVVPGQVLVVMQTNVLVAKLSQAEAQKAQAVASEASAKARIAVQEANLVKAKADLEQRTAVEKNSFRNYKRYKDLVTTNATSKQHYENAETSWFVAKANLAAARSAVKEVEANLLVAKADAMGAKANILAADAEIDSIKADIDDSILRAPIAGRVQYRVAEPGEVLSAGGRALNMVDLTDVYMTFFLPEETVGKVKIGAEVRIILDAAPAYPIPAKVSYVASVAQFTPKTVETRVERQKLMFRVKAHINREILERCIDMVKTGLPGEAWVKLDDAAPWPKELQLSAEAKKKIEALKARKAAEAKVAPRSVVKSDTRNQAARAVVPAATVEKAMKGSPKEALELKVQLVRKGNEAKKAAVEKNVAEAKKHEAAKKASGKGNTK